jgi:hypothetical protein
MHFSRRRLRINDDIIDPAPAFVPFAEYPNWSDKFGDMGKLTGLLKSGVVLGDNGDRADFAFPFPLAHQVSKGNDAVLAECGDKPLQEHELAVGAGASRIECGQEIDHGAQSYLGFGDCDDQSFRVRYRPSYRHRASFRFQTFTGNLESSLGQ